MAAVSFIAGGLSGPAAFAQTVTQIIDSTGDGMGNTLGASMGIAVDGSGNVYVAGQSSHNAFKITPGGVIAEIIDGTGDGFGNTLSFPEDIAVDTSSNVYVAGNGSDNAFKIELGPLPQLTSTVPEDQGVLFRSNRNIVVLNFDGNIAAGAGPIANPGVEVNQLVGCGLGPDLSSNFSFAVENDGIGNPTVLVLEELIPSLTHRSWYTVRNVNFTAADPFTPEFKVIVGDVTGDGLLLSSDVGLINDAVPCVIQGTCDPSLDVNGDGRILNFDVTLANDGLPVFAVPHPCP